MLKYLPKTRQKYLCRKDVYGQAIQSIYAYDRHCVWQQGMLLMPKRNGKRNINMTSYTIFRS